MTTYTRPGIYDQFDAAFRNVSAYVVLRGDKVVAKVTFKFGGAVTAYVHWLGVEMARGQAGGGGYDRQSAAVAKAARKLRQPIGDEWQSWAGGFGAWEAFCKATQASGGKRWDDALRDASFTVLQAV